MEKWIKDIYIKHLKYGHPIDCLQMVNFAIGKKRDYIYIHGISKPSNKFTIEQGINRLINAKVD